MSLDTDTRTTSPGRGSGDTPAPGPQVPDPAAVEEFAGHLVGLYAGGMVTYMIDLGRRTGLLDALATGPATSGGLAVRAGLRERYVREWLGAVVTGGVVTYDPSTGTYALPPERAACLTGGRARDLAPMSQVNTLLAQYVAPVAQAFRDGGGVPYEEYRPEFTDVMDGLGRGLYDEALVTGILPLTGTLPDLLAAGARVADLGCGTGHTTNLLAQAFPASTFVGYDLADDALARARTEAAALGLDNVTFEQRDVASLPAEPPLDAVFAFDAIHDQADPDAVLRRAYAALRPGGWFVMLDVKASSDLAENVGNPFAPLLYAVSTLHCMTVSLAQDGAGLGTVWGERRARTMLGEAGFTGVEVHDVPGDPLDSLYVARRPDAAAAG